MATFKLEYTYYIGDIVDFKVNGVQHRGIVECVSELPDIFVECTDDGTYKRYRVGIDSLELVFSEHDNSGIWSNGAFDIGEKIEFVRGGELGTPEFNEIIYTKSWLTEKQKK